MRANPQRRTMFTIAKDGTRMQKNENEYQEKKKRKQRTNDVMKINER